MPSRFRQTCCACGPGTPEVRARQARAAPVRPGSGLAVPRGTAGLEPPRPGRRAGSALEQDVWRRVRLRIKKLIAASTVVTPPRQIARTANCESRATSCGRSLSTYLRPPAMSAAPCHGRRQLTRPRAARTRSGDPPRARGNLRAGRPWERTHGNDQEMRHPAEGASTPHTHGGSASPRLTCPRRRT
jgi:hypothetical protein